MEQRKSLDNNAMYEDFNRMNNNYNYFHIEGFKEDYDLNIFLVDYRGTEIADNFTHIYSINKRMWYGVNALQKLRIVLPFMYKNNQIKITDEE